MDGISVGSEDLYRNSPQGIQAGSDPGTDPDIIVDYINQVRQAISGTGLSGAAVGHVDTWTAWVNGSNQAVVDASDWLGVDAYPYFQDTMANGIDNGADLFSDAFGQTQAAANGKPVWVTETGWPVSGATVGDADPSTANAQTYWDQVGCDMLFGQVNTWWYTLQDAAPDTPNPAFGLVGNTLGTDPLYDLSCQGVSASSSAGVASSTRAPSATGSGDSAGSAATGSADPTGSAANGSGGDTDGSPGIGAGLSSQLASETSAVVSPSVGGYPVSATASGSAPLGTGSAGSGSAGGSGVNGTATNTAGAGGATPVSPTASSPPIPAAAASGVTSGAFSALIFAIVIAVFAL